jgi:hypothetical protein
LIAAFSSSPTARVDQLEQAAALEVGAHGAGDACAKQAGSPAKSAMATGMRLAPAPVISIESWAWARWRPAGQRSQENFRKISGHTFIFIKIRAFYSSYGLYLISSVRWNSDGIVRLGQRRRLRMARSMAASSAGLPLERFSLTVEHIARSAAD